LKAASSYDQWEDKQTKQKRSKLGVVAETFNFSIQAVAAAMAAHRSSARARPAAASAPARTRRRRRPPQATTFRSDFQGTQIATT
jgi:single-stranded DNA-binding protein